MSLLKKNLQKQLIKNLTKNKKLKYRYTGWRLACAIGAPQKCSVEEERRKIVNSQ